MSRTKWGLVFFPEMRKALVWKILYRPCSLMGAPFSLENSRLCAGCRNCRQ